MTVSCIFVLLICCREEIRRIKANNPDIGHREAFSTAAKNVSCKRFGLFFLEVIIGCFYRFTIGVFKVIVKNNPIESKERSRANYNIKGSLTHKFRLLDVDMSYFTALWTSEISLSFEKKKGSSCIDMPCVSHSNACKLALGLVVGIHEGSVL